MKVFCPTLARPSSLLNELAIIMEEAFVIVGKFIGRMCLVPRFLRWLATYFWDILDLLWPHIKEVVFSAWDLIRPLIHMVKSPVMFFKGYTYGLMEVLQTYASEYVVLSYCTIWAFFTMVLYFATKAGLTPINALMIASNVTPSSANILVLSFFFVGACYLCFSMVGRMYYELWKASQ